MGNGDDNVTMESKVNEKEYLICRKPDVEEIHVQNKYENEQVKDNNILMALDEALDILKEEIEMNPSKLNILNKFVKDFLPDFRVINKSDTQDNSRTQKLSINGRKAKKN